MYVKDASRIIIDNTIVMLQIVASLTDNSRVIIYNHNNFIVQGTEHLIGSRALLFPE